MSSPESVERSERPDIVTRHRGLMGRAVLVSGLTLLSRVLGFVREMIMAALFGDGSAISDAFFTAWRVPNLFRRLLGEGALSTSLQATMTEEDAERGNAAGKRLFVSTVWLTVSLLLVVCTLTMIAIHFMPDRMPVTGWPWLGNPPGPVRDLAVRVMPYVILVCIAALCGGALHVRGHYAVPNLAPTVMNVAWIVALVWIGIHFGWSATGEGTQWAMARWLAWGVLVGGVVQLAIHGPPLVRFGLLGRSAAAPVQVPDKELPRAWTVLRTSAPLALGAAVYQVNVMVDGLMAEGLLRDGGPSALYYANRVQQFPLALVAVAAINSVFPLLKAHGHLGDRAAVRALHDRTQFGILFLALPAAAGLWVLAEPISRALFEHGNYGADGVARIASGLRMLALALVPAGAAGFLGRTYIAMGDLKTPVRISIALLFVNMALNALFVRQFGMDVAGLTLATALTSWVNAVWLFTGLRAKLGLPVGVSGGASHAARIAAAAATCGAAAWGVERAVAADTLALVLAILAGALAFLLAARVLALPELAELRRRLARRSRERESS